MTQSLPSKTILFYVDDDADDIAILEEAFYHYSHAVEIVSFSNGTHLLHFFAAQDPSAPVPCLIILDINLPGINGKDLLLRLRHTDNTKDIPIVLFSTSTLPSEILFAKKLNAGFVSKPLHAAQIPSVIEQLLDHCSEDVRLRIKRG